MLTPFALTPFTPSLGKAYALGIEKITLGP
jgi:hypothetical protein